MSSIQIKTINGSGPYAYEVEYVDEGEQKWNYLGPAANVDQLTNEQREELRDEKSIPQFEISEEVDIGKRAIANEVRDDILEKFGEYALSPEDDRRTTTIKFSGNAPENAIEVAQGQAETIKNQTRSIGQQPLTDGEKSRLDFSERSVFWYRSAKADLQDSGVDDWTSIVDTQIEDPHSQSDNLSESDRSGGRSVENKRRGEDTTTQLEAMNKNEKRALRAVAEDGEEGAREYLIEEAGYDPGEIESAAQEVAV